MQKKYYHILGIICLSLKYIWGLTGTEEVNQLKTELKGVKMLICTYFATYNIFLFHWHVFFKICFFFDAKEAFFPQNSCDKKLNYISHDFTHIKKKLKKKHSYRHCVIN